MLGLSYGERLKSLNVFSIKGRLLRPALIKYGKILCSDSEGYDLAALFQRSLWKRELDCISSSWYCLSVTQIYRRDLLMFAVLEFGIDCLPNLWSHNP